MMLRNLNEVAAGRNYYLQRRNPGKLQGSPFNFGHQNSRGGVHTAEDEITQRSKVKEVVWTYQVITGVGHNQNPQFLKIKCIWIFLCNPSAREESNSNERANDSSTCVGQRGFYSFNFKPNRRFCSHLDSQGRLTSAHDSSLLLTPLSPDKISHK